MTMGNTAVRRRAAAPTPPNRRTAVAVAENLPVPPKKVACAVASSPPSPSPLFASKTVAGLGSVYVDNIVQTPGNQYDGYGIISIGNTVPGKELQWVLFEDILIADRSILIGVSWDDLNACDLVWGKEITIDGKPFLCRLLQERRDIDSASEWDCALEKLDSDNRIWHWKDVGFWCQELAFYRKSERVIRGGDWADAYSYAEPDERYIKVGYRPVLIPQKSKHLNQTKQPFEVKNCTLSVYEIGSIYVGNEVLSPGAYYDGYNSISIGDTVEDKEIQWLRVKDFYVARQNILLGVSWDTLDIYGLVFGRRVKIDGRDYWCRLLKVKQQDDSESEWDLAMQQIGDSDIIWNWEDVWFWGQEAADDNPKERIICGRKEASAQSFAMSDDDSSDLGYRPVLIPVLD